MIVYVLLVYDMLPCNDKFVGMTCHAWKSLVGALVRVCLSLFRFSHGVRGGAAPVALVAKRGECFPHPSCRSG